MMEVTFFAGVQPSLLDRLVKVTYDLTNYWKRLDYCHLV